MGVGPGGRRLLVGDGLAGVVRVGHDAPLLVGKPT